MRWLTVNVPGRPEQEIVLMVPGPPALDPDTAEQVRALLGKGAGSGFIFTTADCWATYEALRAKGVEFGEEPVERFYGIDVGLRDPFGNPLRITQPSAVSSRPRPRRSDRRVNPAHRRVGPPGGGTGARRAPGG